MFKISGSLNTQAQFYHAINKVSARSPYYVALTGTITASFLDFSIPITFGVSSQDPAKVSVPFNVVAVHPKWKWIQGHFGQTNMSFSNYSLAGHQFTGGGIELSPKNIHIALMGGELKKLITYNAQDNNLNNIAYRRWGVGAKLEANIKAHTVMFNFFKGWDDPTSLVSLPTTATIKPQDNIVFNISAKSTLFKKLQLEAEYAVSFYTTNVKDANLTYDPVLTGLIHHFIRTNSTTATYHAVKAAIGYTFKFMNIKFNFEHVDPGYTTLCGYFFNNDLQNYTLSVSTSLLKNKINFAVNGGFQRNNLNSLKESTTQRWIGNLNLTLNVVKNLSMNFGYSNFSSFSRNRPITDPLYTPMFDTLNVYQLNQTANASIGYTYGKTKIKQSTQLNANYTQTVNLTGALTNASAFGFNLPQGVPAHIITTNLNHSMNFVKSKWNLGAGTNANYSILPATSTLFVGGSINTGKSFLKNQLSFNAGMAYNRQWLNLIPQANIVSYKTSLNLKPKFKTNKFGTIALSLSANYIQGFPINTGANITHELNVLTNFVYNFN